MLFAYVPDPRRSDLFIDTMHLELGSVLQVLGYLLLENAFCYFSKVAKYFSLLAYSLQ